jgi:drug/metabolite transporter (DMT)-like permease
MPAIWYASQNGSTAESTPVLPICSFAAETNLQTGRLRDRSIVKLAALILLGFFSVVTGHLLLKIGVTTVGRTDAALAWVLNWRVAGGLALFGVGFVIYILVLRWVPLNVAQSFFAAQFVGVVVGSRFILGEELPSLRLAGIVLIALGIVVVAWSRT